MNFKYLLPETRNPTTGAMVINTVDIISNGTAKEIPPGHMGNQQEWIRVYRDFPLYNIRSIFTGKQQMLDYDLPDGNSFVWTCVAHDPNNHLIEKMHTVMGDHYLGIFISEGNVVVYVSEQNNPMELVRIGQITKTEIRTLCHTYNYDDLVNGLDFQGSNDYLFDFYDIILAHALYKMYADLLDIFSLRFCIIP